MPLNILLSISWNASSLFRVNLKIKGLWHCYMDGKLYFYANNLYIVLFIQMWMELLVCWSWFRPNPVSLPCWFDWLWQLCALNRPFSCQQKCILRMELFVCVAAREIRHATHVLNVQTQITHMILLPIIKTGRQLLKCNNYSWNDI